MSSGINPLQSEDNSIILGTERVLVDGVIKEQIYFNEGKIISPTNKDDYFFGETVHIGTKLLIPSWSHYMVNVLQISNLKFDNVIKMCPRSCNRV